MTDEAHIELRILSQPRYLCVARAAIGAAVEKLGFPEEDCAHVMLAVDEAITNVIRHGYDMRDDGPIWIRLTPHEGADGLGFELVIEDEARQVDPQQIRSRDLKDVRPGGLGVHIIRQVMDKVEYAPRPGGGMRLVMIKNASAGALSQSQQDTESS